MNFGTDLHWQILKSFWEENTFPTCLSTLYDQVHALSNTSLINKKKCKRKAYNNFWNLPVFSKFKLGKTSSGNKFDVSISLYWQVSLTAWNTLTTLYQLNLDPIIFCDLGYGKKNCPKS